MPAEGGFFGLFSLLQGRNGGKEVLSVDFHIFSEHFDCNFNFLCVFFPDVGLAIIGVHQSGQLLFDLLVREVTVKEHQEKERCDHENGKEQKNRFDFAERVELVHKTLVNDFLAEFYVVVDVEVYIMDVLDFAEIPTVEKLGHLRQHQVDQLKVGASVLGGLEGEEVCFVCEYGTGFYGLNAVVADHQLLSY